MRRWLSIRNANTAAWVLLGLLALAVLAFVASVFAPRGIAGVRDAVRSSAPVAPSVADAPVSPNSLPGPMRRVVGTLDRVEGDALLLRESGGEDARVILRGDATVMHLLVTRGADGLAAGDAVIVGPVVEQRDSTAVVIDVAVIAAPENVAAERCARVGVVTDVTAGRLVFESRCGERRVPLSRDLRVTRYSAANPSQFRAGQRVALIAERLPDGTLAASSVQILESR